MLQVNENDLQLISMPGCCAGGQAADESQHSMNPQANQADDRNRPGRLASANFDSLMFTHRQEANSLVAYSNQNNNFLWIRILCSNCQ